MSFRKWKLTRNKWKITGRKNTVREKRREGKEKLEMWRSGQRQRYCDGITYTERGIDLGRGTETIRR